MLPRCFPAAEGASPPRHAPTRICGARTKTKAQTTACLKPQPLALQVQRQRVGSMSRGRAGVPQLSRQLGELGLQQAAPPHTHIHTRQPAPHPTRTCKASSSHNPLPAAARHFQGQGAELARGQAGGAWAEHSTPGLAKPRRTRLRGMWTPPRLALGKLPPHLTPPLPPLPPPPPPPRLPPGPDSA